MATAFLHNFEWDPSKAQQNLRKHRVSFERAATVFLDPDQVSVLDDEHDDNEERFITLGIDNSGVMLVVVHTFRQMDLTESNIRIISARKATGAEVRQYEETGS